MTSPDPSSAVTSLFRCKIPRLAGWAVVLTLPEVQTVTRLPAPSAVPLTPDYVYGVTLWNDQIVTVLDLAAALSGSARAHFEENRAVLIAQVLGSAPAEWVGWPVTDEANMITLGTRVRSLEIPEAFNATLIHAAFEARDEHALLLNLDGLAISGDQGDD